MFALLKKIKIKQGRWFEKDKKPEKKLSVKEKEFQKEMKEDLKNLF